MKVRKFLKVRRFLKVRKFGRSEGFEGQKVGRFLKVRRFWRSEGVWILSHTDKRMVLYLDSASVSLWFVRIWVMMISLISARGDSVHHCDALSEPRLCNYVHWAFFKYCFIFWTIGLYTSQPSSLVYLECASPTPSSAWIIQRGSPTAAFSYRQASFKWQLEHELPVLTEQQ